MYNRVLQDIEPKEVFRYFEDLTRIPRESGNEGQAVKYLIAFAKKNGLEWYLDEYLNVLIRKKASPGYEGHPGVILQGHSDMVCEKNAGTQHDFEKDPIKIEIEGDKIIAKETTLGADDGIGVALALALLADKNAQHPALELVCTSDEERGMVGAENFDIGLLKGKILINLDANEEGVFIVGCAGGPAISTEIPLEREAAAEGLKAIRLKLSGLLGGHSGEDINRGRANSIKLMVRLLMAIQRELPFKLADFRAGLKYNAIPREAETLILVSEKDVEKVQSVVAETGADLKKEYRVADKDIAVSAVADGDALTYQGDVLTEKSTEALLDYICFAESGILRMDMEFKDTVESSVSIGNIHLDDDKAILQTLTRSSLKSVYMETYYKIERLAKHVGGTLSLMSNCPEWEYDPNSSIKEIFNETYRKMYGKDANNLIIHAGLECGVFKKNAVSPLDMIAAGPDARNLHTPGEYLSISSTARFWDFFQEVIKRI